MKGRRGGFTVAELLVAMMISSIVLGAVATLAFATGKADRAMDELLTARQLTRFNNSKISDALRYSRRAFRTPNGNVAFWRADDEGEDDESNVANNKINGSELLFLRTEGSDLRLYQFEFRGKTTNCPFTIATLDEAPTDEPIRLEVSIAEIENDTAFNELLNLAVVNRYVTKQVLVKLPDKYNLDVDNSAGVKMAFSDVAFGFPAASNPHYTRLTYNLIVTRINQSGQVTSQVIMPYSLVAHTLASAENLIDETG